MVVGPSNKQNKRNKTTLPSSIVFGFYWSMSAKDNLGGCNSGYSLQRASSELGRSFSRLGSIVYGTVSNGCLAWKNRFQKVNIS